MLSGLPGGSSGEGPATIAGLILVAIVTLGGFALLTWMLFLATP
jgi:hypothetical protein